MTVLDYVNISNFEDFSCNSDTAICIEYVKHYKYRGEWRKSKPKTVVHSATNLCHKNMWREYQSFNRFANKELMWVDDNTDRKYLYCHWSVEDLMNEWKELMGDKYEVIGIEWTQHLEDFRGSY